LQFDSQHDAVALTNGKEIVRIEYINTAIQMLRDPFIRHPLKAFNLNISYE